MVYFDKVRLVFADKPQGQMAAWHTQQTPPPPSHTYTHKSNPPQGCQKFDEPQFKIEATKLLVRSVAGDLWTCAASSTRQFCGKWQHLKYEKKFA